MEWPAPRNVEEVRSFMALASYYKWFIKKFSHISYPIRSLQRKGNKFEWTEECVASFDKLKLFLTNSLVLKIVDLDKEFMVCTNSCKRGLGSVLMQKGQVVCYETRKLNEHKYNYVTHDFVLETIIHALIMWRHYLLSRRFILMSDHSGLGYFFDQPNMNSR